MTSRPCCTTLRNLSRVSELAGFDELFVEFGGELRRAGLTVGTDNILTFCTALATLNPTDLLDVYWAGRNTLVRRREHLRTYDSVFRRFFLDEAPDESNAMKIKFKASANASATLELPSTEEGTAGSVEEEVKMGLMASASEIFRSKEFGECTPEELAALRRMMSAFRLSPPRRRTRRLTTVDRGRRLHVRRMVRTMMRTHGESHEIVFQERKLRLRPIIFILDVSGSMAYYSRNLLQLAYSARRAHQRVEVFCFGTRLTRISKSLDRRSPDAAMALAGGQVLDWDGGTRIGDSIDAFVRGWGRGGMSRGAVVVICSDALDRGDPGVLAEAMEALSRVSYKVLWMNPHKGDNRNFRPNTMGMMVAAPYVDEIVSGHNLQSLEEFSRLLASLR